MVRQALALAQKRAVCGWTCVTRRDAQVPAPVRVRLSRTAVVANDEVKLRRDQIPAGTPSPAAGVRVRSRKRGHRGTRSPVTAKMAPEGCGHRQRPRATSNWRGSVLTGTRPTRSSVLSVLDAGSPVSRKPCGGQRAASTAGALAGGAVLHGCTTTRAPRAEAGQGHLSPLPQAGDVTSLHPGPGRSGGAAVPSPRLTHCVRVPCPPLPHPLSETLPQRVTLQNPRGHPVPVCRRRIEAAWYRGPCCEHVLREPLPIRLVCTSVRAGRLDGGLTLPSAPPCPLEVSGGPAGRPQAKTRAGALPAWPLK